MEETQAGTSPAQGSVGYEPPSIVKLGSFVELTQGTPHGTKKDKAGGSV